MRGDGIESAGAGGAGVGVDSGGNGGTGHSGGPRGTGGAGVESPSDVRSVRVGLGERAYDVLVGHGAARQVAGLVPAGANQAVVVTQSGIAAMAGTLDLGVATTVVEIPDGERAKSVATLAWLWRRFAELGLDRRDVVVGLGGGVVTDVAGFAAACWHRGTPVVHVPTTLLGQVDAAIGGKSGVNLPEGKNLVGAFWQPLGVVCDPDLLASLPPAEWRSGRGEMAKYAFLGVEGLPELALVEQIRACVECKARVVTADERDGGLRAVLNYGHTLAHALEAFGLAGESGDLLDAASSSSDTPLVTAPAAGAAPLGHRPHTPLLRHGEAVAVGLVFAGRLAGALGRIDEERVRRHETVVASYDLPCALPPGAEPDGLVALMRRDKKAHGDLTFVLDGRRGVELVSGVDQHLVLEVLATLRTPDAKEAA